MRVLGISGSLRRDSHNAALLRAAAALLPPGAELELWEDLKAVPPYDADDDYGLIARPESLRSLARRDRATPTWSCSRRRSTTTRSPAR